MSIARAYSSWSEPTQRLEDYGRCSPALVELTAAASRLWRLRSVGCHGVRPIRGGTAPSVHSWGGAVDLSYRGVSRQKVEADVIPWLVAWSEEWGLTSIHDYVGCRIWHAGRTPVEAEACDRWWRAAKPDRYGMGKAWADWLHVEVHPSRWADDRSALERGIN